MYCPYCRAENPDDGKRCVECGKALATWGNSKCPECGAEISRVASYCFKCGATIKSSIPSSGPIDEAPDLDKRLQSTVNSMVPWIRFLGIAMMIAGLPSLLWLVGVVPISLGALIFWTASDAKTFGRTGSMTALNGFLSKMKIFIIVACFPVAAAALLLLALVVFAGSILGGMGGLCGFLGKLSK